jgi:predicted nucleotidyltransferase
VRNIQNISAKAKRILKRYYGKRFKGLVLYGSVARRQHDPSSDIDFLVLLDGPFHYFRELRAIIHVLYPLQLETERLISAKPVAWEDFENGSLQLYRNAQKDGALI